MPHSTQASADSRQTFDLSSAPPEEQPMNSNGNGVSSYDLMGDRSGPYGVALSSTAPGLPQRDPRRDSREDLPSQRSSVIAPRRKSMPDAYAYQDLIKNGASIDNVPVPQRPSVDSMRTNSYNDSSRRRTQYYEDQFQYKDNVPGAARERVQKQSPILAEMKTNVIIKDEFTLVTDLSHHLAQRYTRPDSAIMIKVDHSACIAMGGTFDPCYILTIHAVPSQMGPSTNKRNAALIQQFMAEILSVPADRGLVTFVAIPEENYATNGNTILGEVERVEKQDQGSVKQVPNGAARKSMTFNKKSISRADTAAYGNGISLPSESERSSPIPRQSTPAGNKSTSLQQTQLADASEIERPRTAHGSFAAENGLRMNGVSAEQLVGKNSRTPNGRPKTFAGPSSASDQFQPEPMPMPTMKRHSQVQPQRSKHTPIQPRMTGNHVPLAPRPVQLQHNPSNTSSITSVTRVTTSKSAAPQVGSEPRTKNTYLDNISTLTSKTEVPAVRVTDDDDAKSTKSRSADRTANTAKRRSTVTATPKMPNNLPVPPPMPDDSKSMSSRLNKRKSFMKIFKRESAPAWYK